MRVMFYGRSFVRRKNRMCDIILCMHNLSVFSNTIVVAKHILCDVVCVWKGSKKEAF